MVNEGLLSHVPCLGTSFVSPSVCLHTSWFKNFNLFQPQPVHEKKMATLITLSSLHFDVIKWNQKALLKVQKAV